MPAQMCVVFIFFFIVISCLISFQLPSHPCTFFYQTNNNTGGRRRTFKHQVHEWTGREVTMWLRALKLDQYLETFARNEITGSVLLDLGQSDLDYMQIKALGHRKIIMREIERLKRGKSSVDLRQGGTMDASPPKKASSPTSRQQSQRDGRGKRLLTVNNSDSTPDLSLNGTSTSTSSNTSTQNNGQQQQQQQRFRFAAAETDTSPQQRQRQEQLQRSKSNENRRAHAGSKSRSPSSSPQRTVQHWSHVKPISENEITGDGTVPVNLADGDYNEARQQQAFQQAVNEWRNGGTTTGAGSKTSSSSSTSTASTMLGGGGGGGGLSTLGGGGWNNPLGSPEPKTSTANELAEGTLDVAAEQIKFQQAVMEWRNGGTNPTSPTTHTPETSDASASTFSSTSSTSFSSSTSSSFKTSPTSSHSNAYESKMNDDSSNSSSSNKISTQQSKFDGKLDEAGEHEKFRQAVAEWRNGNGNGEQPSKTSPGGRSTAVANNLLIKMAEEDRQRREKFQIEKETLEADMRRERDALTKRRNAAAEKLAASKYSDEANNDSDVGGKTQENNNGSLTARRKYQKWEDVAGIEIEY